MDQKHATHKRKAVNDPGEEKEQEKDKPVAMSIERVSDDADDDDSDVPDVDNETEQADTRRSKFVMEDHGVEDELGDIELSGSDSDSEQDMPDQSDRRTDLVQTDSDLSDGDVPSPPPSSPTPGDADVERVDVTSILKHAESKLFVAAIKRRIAKDCGNDDDVEEKDLTNLPCRVCKDAKDDKSNPILICDKCKALTHANCHKPAVSANMLPDDGYWYCSGCAPTVIQIYPSANSPLLWTTPDFSSMSSGGVFGDRKKFDVMREGAVLGQHASTKRKLAQLSNSMMDLTIDRKVDSKVSRPRVRFRVFEDEEKGSSLTGVTLVRGYAGVHRSERELVSRLYYDGLQPGHDQLVRELYDIVGDSDLSIAERLVCLESIRLKFARRMFGVWSICSSEKLTITLSDGLFMSSRDFIDTMGPKYETFMVSKDKPAGPLLTDAFHFSNKRVFRFVEEWCRKIKCPIIGDYDLICRVIARQEELVTDVSQQLEDDKTDATELHHHIQKMEDYLFGTCPVDEVEGPRKIRRATLRVVRAERKAEAQDFDGHALRKAFAAHRELQKVVTDEKTEVVDCPANVARAVLQLRDRAISFLERAARKKKKQLPTLTRADTESDADSSDADGSDSDVDLEFDPRAELKTGVLSSVDTLMTTVKVAIQIYGEENVAFSKFDDLKHQFDLLRHFNTQYFDEVKLDLPILYNSERFGVSRSAIYKQLNVPRELIEPFGKSNSDVIPSVKLNGQSLLRVLVYADSDDSPDVCRDIAEAKLRVAQAGEHYEKVSGEAHHKWVISTLSRFVRCANERIYARSTKGHKLLDSCEVNLRWPRDTTVRLERLRDNLQNLHDFVTGVFDAIDKRMFTQAKDVIPFIDVIRNALPQLAFPDLGCLSDSKRIWTAPVALSLLSHAAKDHEMAEAKADADADRKDMEYEQQIAAQIGGDGNDCDADKHEDDDSTLDVLFPDSFLFCNKALVEQRRRVMEKAEADARTAEIRKGRAMRSAKRAKLFHRDSVAPASASATVSE
jgi:hypothetical protein